MNIIETFIKDLLIVEPSVFPDSRGYFFESFNRDRYIEAGIKLEFVQDNISKSSKNVLRGLHFQNPPYAQGKLVSVLQGAVLDVAVDIRKNSPTYGMHYSVELTGENKRQFFIPPGFAHGFLTLKDETFFSYKCTSVYSKTSEGALRWNDPDLNIDWGTKTPIVSEKDQNAPLFKNFQSQF